ncbi:glycoside hydrolase family 65 protein [Lapidilactobacillus achengensis]|uniref:Glycoside hydrolase family 65 protein n=1 Tax=Lapidilactobacillus achengensis TaxID=2486000 RepID=A0ABW1UNK9_9LACO|nr:glycosyl hydrolase family 65 protein [Lapidilactobacillus achengensis]
MHSTIKYYPDDPWRLSEACFDPRNLNKYESIFALGNGYLGTRAATEESYLGEQRDTFIAGSFDKFGSEASELPNLADIFQLKILLNGQLLDLTSGTVTAYLRTLNLKTGELTREFVWTIGGAAYQFRFSRFVSLANRHLLGEKVQITPLTAAAQLKMTVGIDGQVTNRGTQHFNDDIKRLYPEHTLQLLTQTNTSQINFVITSSHRFDGEDSQMIDAKTAMLRRKLVSTYHLTLAAKQTLNFENISTIYTSRDNDCVYHDRQSLQQRGLDQAKALRDQTYDQLVHASAQAWLDQVWGPLPLVITSTDFRDQLALNFARYHLQIMTPAHDPRMNIGAKGLSGEGYKGHTFWDTDLFMLPYFIFTAPAVARSLVTYRYLTLPGARQKAAADGYTGAQYPWESAWITEGETASVWGATDIVTGKATKIWSGFIEQHITADVAFGVNEYIEATQDQQFAREMGTEIILDTGRFWASRLDWQGAKQRYEIRDVIGPDEYKEHANNNAFTNYMAHWNMSLALELVKKLPQTDPVLYARLDQQMNLHKLHEDLGTKLPLLYVPEPNQDEIIPQDDAYLSKQNIDLSKYLTLGTVDELFDHFSLDQINELQVTKQADVILLLYMFEDKFAKSVKQKNWDYYEPRTTHDSSLSRCTYTNFAADLGLDDKAYWYYQQARDIDLGPNMKSSDAGVHAASLAGIWLMTIFGFGGVRYLNGKLRVAPNLPAAWQRLDFYLWWHSQKLHFVEDANQVTVLNVTATANVSICANEQNYPVPTDQPLVIKRRGINE